MKSIMTISEVSKRTGIASSALRYYEDRGLIESERAGSGHRRYSRSTLRRIAFIVFAQRIGLSLDEITEELAKLPTDRIPKEKDWSELSGKWVNRIEKQMADLEKLRTGLLGCIGCGCLSFDKCHIYNPEDRTGRNGPGPRYWL